MPVESIEENVDDSGRKRVSFERSVLMSTYLYAMAIFREEDFGCVEDVIRREGEGGEGEEEEPVAVRVWARKPSEGRFALECAVKALPIYEKYFEEKFPLKKCDLIAVSEFAAGAMENWGLITFRETALLMPEGSAAATKERVALVVVHELAHQWFGNLVTMDWWDDLWLNEGFAVFCQYFITDQFLPELEVWKQFVSRDYCAALSLDSLESSHPIEVPITKAEQVDEIFDAISYRKGCCIVRMAVDYLGFDDFRKGIVSYLREFKYGNATTDDLWRHLAAASGKEVHDLMSFWTKVTGYPYLIVRKGETTADGKNTLLLEQKKFLITGDDVEFEPWPIPLSYVTEAGEEREIHKVLMPNKTLVLELPEGKDWAFFNPGCEGFYRVLYDDADLASSLRENLEFFPDVDRFALMNDAVAMTTAGYMDVSSAVAWLEALKGEEAYLVLDAMCSMLRKLRTLVQYEDETLEKFDTFARGVLAVNKPTVGKWQPQEDFNHIQVMKQKLVVGALVHFEDPDLSEEIVRLFGADPTLESVSPDLRDLAMKVVVRKGGRDAFEAVKKRFVDADSNAKQVQALRSLGMSADPELQREALDFVYSDEVKKQDKIYLFMSVATNTKARQLFWDDFVENWGTLNEMFEGGIFMLAYIVKFACSVWDTHESADMVEEFFQRNPCPPAAKSIRQGLEAIKARAQFTGRSKQALVDWLGENVQ